MMQETLSPDVATLLDTYQRVRAWTRALCASLETEDYVVQPTPDVSPPKWHLGHTTWFWESFILAPHWPGYRVFHDDFSFVFNSYYESAGRRVLRTQRGNLSRPTVAQVYAYRTYVDDALTRFLTDYPLTPALRDLIELGLNHEQQHQELLVTDIKYILGHNPLFPVMTMPVTERMLDRLQAPVRLLEGTYTIGFQPEPGGFCFDNELHAHKVYLNDAILSGALVSNGDYMNFIEAGGYRQFQHWLSDGWAWVNANQINAPLYWYKIEGQWHTYSFDGLQPVAVDEPVCHVSYYEADAYARWRGLRLPTEAEWEVAATGSQPFGWGLRWEWTASAYLPYPGFSTAEGAVGEYNGKFMSGQMVLRGASVATPAGHSRPTYRNFFQPDKRWQYTGIRLVLA